MQHNVNKLYAAYLYFPTCLVWGCFLPKNTKMTQEKENNIHLTLEDFFTRSNCATFASPHRFSFPVNFLSCKLR